MKLMTLRIQKCRNFILKHSYTILGNLHNILTIGDPTAVGVTTVGGGIMTGCPGIG